jgi:hypothetical protein
MNNCKKKIGKIVSSKALKAKGKIGKIVSSRLRRKNGGESKN